KMIADGIGSLLAAKDLKSNEGATARHLPLDDLGLGMIRPAGIANLDNVTMAAEEVRDPPSALLLLANAQGKGFKRFQENPGIERRWAGTCLLIKRMNLVFDDFAAAENDAPETSAVPVDMFCRRINDAIGAKLERLLQNGRGKDVVDDKTRAIFMRYARYCSNIIYFQTWIGGRFEKQELCFGPHCRPPLAKITAIDEGRGDAKARQQILDHIEAGAEHGAGRDHMIAGLELCHERRRDRGHAARSRARRFRPLEQSHPLLEHVDGGIGITGIDIARRGAFHPRLGRFHVRVSVGLGQEQGLGDFAKLRAHGAAMDELGRRMQGFHVRLLPASGHPGLLVAAFWRPIVYPSM